jgi:hypothetical protein
MCQIRITKRFFYYFHLTTLSVGHTVRGLVFIEIVTYKPVRVVDWFVQLTQETAQ